MHDAPSGASDPACNGDDPRSKVIAQLEADAASAALAVAELRQQSETLAEAQRTQQVQHTIAHRDAFNERVRLHKEVKTLQAKLDERLAIVAAPPVAAGCRRQCEHCAG